MAADFIRIGGEIISAPLNENFRRLRNDISMANVNLVFSEEHGTKENVDAMLAIDNPQHGQVCYVVSSGELYRYSNGDGIWHKIADFGQTYRQGFLNSGVVVMSDPLKLKEGTTDTLIIPEMLVYYKNQSGDQTYLKGMYKIHTREFTPNITVGNTFSVLLDANRDCVVQAGLLKQDNPNLILLGTFSTDKTGNIIEQFIFTTPHIAYNADRGLFLTQGGQVSGLDLAPSSDKKVSRREGLYYSEGINVTIGQTEKFPADTDNGSNFNTKYFEAVSNATLYYMFPDNSLISDISEKSEIDVAQYYNSQSKKLGTVEAGEYTIQRHLVTPNGLNIILYGDEVFNSQDTAEAALNNLGTVNINFPHVEVTRMVVGNISGFSITNEEHFKPYTMQRLALAGTVDPEFADEKFIIYDNSNNDTSPASLRFDLGTLRDAKYNDLYVLQPKKPIDTAKYFSLSKKYVQGGEGSDVPNTYDTEHENRNAEGEKGYIIPTQSSVDNIENRLEAIEKEIWNMMEYDDVPKKILKPIYEQSIRYRLDQSEQDINKLEEDMSTFLASILTLTKEKVHKNTTINGHKLGDDLNSTTEEKPVILKTGDISEGTSNDDQTLNLWFRQDRVSDNADVKEALKHARTTGNPHGSTTDDVKVKAGSDNNYITTEEKGRISLTNLPTNTITELNKKLEGLQFSTISGTIASPSGKIDYDDIKGIKFYTDGIRLQYDETNKIAEIECVGQADPADFMEKTAYAMTSTKDPDYAGYVEKAITAKNIEILDKIKGQKSVYYGTNDAGTIGAYTLPVTTVDTSDSVNVETVAFEPIKHSITLKHLADATAIYTASNEETSLGTNVYDLVKNRYHRVLNSKVQGPYDDEGNLAPALAYHNYKVPYEQLKARTYYFTYGNDCYKFTLSSALAANTELRYYFTDPDKLVYVTGNTETVIEHTKVDGSAVEPEYVLSFTSATDWDCINTWNFGNNLTVTVTDGCATINAEVAGSGATSFSNLGDVAVEYNDGNIGKLLQLTKNGSGEYRIGLREVRLQEYMEIAKYVENTTNDQVKYAKLADTATSADKLQTIYSVNNDAIDARSLWTSNKIVNYIDNRLINDTPDTYAGYAVPSNSMGKSGDLYILIEQ